MRVLTDAAATQKVVPGVPQRRTPAGIVDDIFADMDKTVKKTAVQVGGDPGKGAAN